MVSCVTMLLVVLSFTPTHALQRPASSETTLCDLKNAHRLTQIEATNPNIKCALLLDDTLVFPRNIVVDGNNVWLIDKGSNLFDNGKPRGSLYVYKFTGGEFIKTRVMADLDDPNDLAIRRHGDGSKWLYFTSRRKLQRFKLGAEQPGPNELIIETVLDRLPTDGWHKLLAIEVTNDDLFLTVPSLTDHCEVDGIFRLVEYPCFEERYGTASIRRYRFSDDNLSENYELIAVGLRDALAAQVTPSEGHLIVADNGWDQIDLSDTSFEYESTPNDEINIIDLAHGGDKPKPVIHFGWPYCFNNAEITPPYKRFVKNCDGYQRPYALLPAHSAPLSMSYLGEELLIALHGNNDNGGQIMSFAINDRGLPIASGQVKLKLQYDIKRGLSEKNQAVRARPLGLAPFGNNAILISDDWNHQLIKIVFAD